ncbi:hypothetical protein [Haloechinothrix sp. LS1_15]|uniref:PDC sensor domain-containing protein n=1 Tax=Haloechinothrix sp. LS1_15 TaxID=2652248 RepID=UPI0029468A81|nr:hypothetical protein [Haloechinothrix sp. LS1_15]MDV6011702.1 hypothetical protein [Haloechinothrix sp. LS1_15]
MSSVIDAVFAGVDALRRLTVEVHERAAGEGRLPGTADLASIRPTVFQHLASGVPVISGTGVIAAPGSLADRPRWLEWWRTPRGSAAPRPLTVDLDPHHIGGYEYTSTTWFDKPRRTGQRVVVGPYVDYAGTDEYILTFSCPIRSAERFLGVAAADVRTSDLEAMMLPLLDAVAPVCLLVNATGRVITSNTVDAIAGALVPERLRRSSRIPVAQDGTPCEGLPWYLIWINGE